MDLKLNADDIERLVKETILRSSFGTAVANAVTKSLSGYNSPVDEAVKVSIRTTVAELLEGPDYKPQIEQACRDAINARLNKELLAKLAESTIQKIERAASDY